MDFVDYGLEVGAAARDEDCCSNWLGHFEGFDEGRKIGGVILLILRDGGGVVAGRVRTWSFAGASQ